MPFRKPPKLSKHLEPSDSSLRNTPEKRNMTQVKGKEIEKKGLLRGKKNRKKKGMLALSENHYQHNLGNFYKHVILCLGKPAFVVFFKTVRKGS